MPSGIYVSGQGEAIYQHAKTLSNFCNELQMKAIFKHPIHQKEKKGYVPTAFKRIDIGYGVSR
jgi:hypothetical protein